MSNTSFRLMSLFMGIEDTLRPHRIDERVEGFEIKRGMTVVDYGCGPGRYNTCFSRLVGDGGMVYVADIQELAIKAVREKMRRYGLMNVEPVLAHGYDSGLPDQIADRVAALDIFHGIPGSDAFLGELNRLTKRDGLLIIDDGHQSRISTQSKVLASGRWEIVEENPDHLKCRPCI